MNRIPFRAYVEVLGLLTDCVAALILGRMKRSRFVEYLRSYRPKASELVVLKAEYACLGVMQSAKKIVLSALSNLPVRRSLGFLLFLGRIKGICRKDRG